MPVDKKKSLTNVTKNAILDGAETLQTRLKGAFLGWTLLKDKRNKVQPSTVFFQKRIEPRPPKLGTGEYISYI